MNRFAWKLLGSMALVLASSATALADDATLTDSPLAIASFRERGDEVRGMGGQVADLLFAKLVTAPELVLVDREDLSRTLEEQELNLSGAVDPAQAIQIGRLTGAKILLTGSVFQVENSLHVVAKLIGTETTRVVGASVNGSANDGIDDLASQLGDEIVEVIRKNAASLVAPPMTQESRVAELNKAMGDAKRPTVRVAIAERHVGQSNFDPAAQTEFIKLCQESGFTVLDENRTNARQADVIIEGDGLTEFAARRGNLISVKGRLEVKAVDRATGRVLAADRQTVLAVDLSEQLSSKDALQAAAAEIASRLLPKLTSKSPAAQ